MSDLPIDHLLYGVPNLDMGIEYIYDLTGVKPVIGGSHPGLGTRNALLGLGNEIYLEIIAPDPDQNVDRVWMDLDQLDQPKLFRWAAFSNDLDNLREHGLNLGIDIGQINSGQRQTPEGDTLSWTLSDPNVVLGDGLIPFFIDWGKQGNPTPTLPEGCRLISFQATHPKPDAIVDQLRCLKIELKIGEGPEIQLLAEIATPNGLIKLH